MMKSVKKSRRDVKITMRKLLKHIRQLMKKEITHSQEGGADIYLGRKVTKVSRAALSCEAGDVLRGGVCGMYCPCIIS